MKMVWTSTTPPNDNGLGDDDTAPALALCSHNNCNRNFASKATLMGGDEGGITPCFDPKLIPEMHSQEEEVMLNDPRQKELQNKNRNTASR